MKSLILVLKGFFMGIANVIPGVSGGTIALILGIYEEFISSISNIFKEFKKSISFLIPIFIGMGLSIILLSRIIDRAYKIIPIPTVLFFMGLVVGGIPLVIKRINNSKDKITSSNYIIFIITFLLVLSLSLSKIFISSFSNVSFTNMNILSYILLFIVGIVSSATMIIPGISGSLVLMMLGYYYPVINTIKEITSFKNLFSNFIILFIFGLGVLLGIAVISKMIEYLFKKHEKKTYFTVLGFVIASVIAIPISSLIEVKNINLNIGQLLLGIITFIIGLIISYKLGEK